MRELGVDVWVPAGLPINQVPQTWGLDHFPWWVSAVVRLPGQRFFEIRVLDPSSDLVGRLRAREDVVFATDARFHDKSSAVAHAQLLDTHTLVGRIDLLDPGSEAAHRFWTVDNEGVFSGNPTPEKVLAYLEPVAPLTVHTQGHRAVFRPIAWESTPLVRDHGRAITGEAHWLVDGVRADRNLTVVFRSDRAAFARYTLFVDGQPVPHTVQFLHGRDSWEDVAVVVPHSLLSDGINDLGLVRDRGLDHAAVVHHIWCFQERSRKPRAR
jgi:hypothetical protein